MAADSTEWTRQFARGQMHDGIERLIDQVTPGNTDRLARDPGAFDEIIAVHDLAVSVAEELLLETVTAARRAGRTWTQIGEALGISRQEAQARFTGVRTGGGSGAGSSSVTAGMADAAAPAVPAMAAPPAIAALPAQLPPIYAQPAYGAQVPQVFGGTMAQLFGGPKWQPSVGAEFGHGMFGSRKKATWVPTITHYLAPGERLLFITSATAETLSSDNYRIVAITDQRMVVVGDNKGLTFALTRPEITDFKFNFMDFLTVTTPLGPMKVGNIDTKDIPIVNRLLGR